MRRILSPILFLLALAIPVVAQDATKADPNHYKIESENSRVRVVRAKYGPHEKSVMHSHPDLVAIFLTDGRVKFTYPGGKTEEVDMKAGTTLFAPATTHLPENMTDGVMEIVLVELKGAMRKPAKNNHH